MPVASVNWLWIGNRPLLDSTPNTPIFLSERRAIIGHEASGSTQIQPVTVSGDYVSQGTNANNFASIWDANAKGIAPTRFSYSHDGTDVQNANMVSAFAVTMRVQTASDPDEFQNQPATLVQMSNGDMFFRPNVNYVGAWDGIDRVHSIEVVSIDESAGTAYGSINHRTSFSPEIFDVDFAVCYLRGTRIMTAHGEVAVEDLKEGDLVVCRFGGLRAVRWIGRQSVPGTVQNADVRAIRFAPGAIADAVPRAPLFVSAGHSMLIGESLVLASDLMNGITITREGHRDRWDYFQIDLGVHDLVLAEGAWSETFADCGRFRDRFDNVMDYRRRFPAEAAPETPLLCAPRPTGGAAFHAALQQTARRALRKRGDAPGRLEGRIEEFVAPGRLSGWAVDTGRRGSPVELEIVLRGDVIGIALACVPRRGKSQNGRMGFVFETEHVLSVEDLRRLVLRRREDGAEIAPISPAAPGPMHGHLDRIEWTGRLEGWARDKDNPDHSILLEVLFGDEILGTVLACRPRSDLTRVGFGDAAFVLELGRELGAAQLEGIQLRRACDGAVLRRSEATTVAGAAEASSCAA